MFKWFKREPRMLVERRELLSPFIADYPLYQPPYRQGPNFLRRSPNQEEEAYLKTIPEFTARGDENFAYFMEQRASRMASLQSFLAKFGVSASPDDAGLADVSRWFPYNAFALVPSLRDWAVGQAFFQMKTPWIDELRGLNVIFDLGIFFGEALIRKQPCLHWKFHYGASDHGEAYGTGYQVDGFRRRTKSSWIDPPGYIAGECQNDLNGLQAPRRRVNSREDTLVNVARAYAEL
jgi:hypothetical protein